MAGERTLTGGEIAMLSGVYGDAIDYSEVQVRDGGTKPLTGFTPFNTINVGKGLYSNDFSLVANVEHRAFFVHEAAHVLQLQNGRPPLVNGLLPQIFSTVTGRIEERYDFSDKLADGVDFKRWTIEEQARYFEYLYMRLEEKRGATLDPDRKPAIPSLEELLAVDTSRYSGLALGGAVERDECFLAGTPVTMADGSTKPIEQVEAGDWVLSFDHKTGETKPGRVKRTMQNRAKIILDFHGTFVTPGHVYWCAGGTFEGRFAPLIDILRDDGVIQHQDGTLIRASSGCAVGSPDDEQFWAYLTREEPDGTDRVLDRRQLRFGTRWMLPDGSHFSMREYMAGIGVQPQRDGSMLWVREGIVAPFVWVLSDRLPNPEDFVLARSQTTLADIYRAGEWEAIQPTMPAPMVRDGGPMQPESSLRLAATPQNVPLALAGGVASSSLLPERAGR